MSTERNRGEARGMEVVGWIGAICLALCGIPLARKTIVDGHADGVDLSFLLLWTVGEILGLIYVLALGSWPLIANYVVNVLACIVILRYKVGGRDE